MKTKNKTTINIENFISSILLVAPKYVDILSSNNLLSSSIDGIIYRLIYSTAI